MLSLGSLAFISPWLLLALGSLPVIWWLLRVTPPRARVVRFPAIRLLAGLVAREETPAHTPLWLILLRLVLAGLVILGLAHPVLNPGTVLPGTGPLLLVVDDGWAAARDWPARQDRMLDLIDHAAREGRDVAFLTTALGTAKDPVNRLAPPAAAGRVRAMQPQPVPTDRAAALKRLDAAAIGGAPAIYWLCDGLDDETTRFGQGLAALGPVEVMIPDTGSLPHLVGAGPSDPSGLTVRLRRAETGVAAPVPVVAHGGDGRVLAETVAQFAEDQTVADATFKIPVELRNRIERVDLGDERTAAAALLLDERARRRPVGVATIAAEGTGQPLLTETYYLEKALDPFAEVRRGGLAALVGQKIAMLLLPDSTALSGDETKQLRTWIEAGGVLVRFAGPRLVETTKPDLLPVTLRRGGRTLGGALSWDKPAHLAAFAAESPFAGLSIPDDVTIERQVLAEPAPDLPAKTWAKLADGTPLVTGEGRGKGWVVLVHTTANTDWSNLALSGLFVDMLRRLVQLGPGVAADNTVPLPPWKLLDGFAALNLPVAQALPITADALVRGTIDAAHWPGFYGTEDAHQALNLGPSVTRFTALSALPTGVERGRYRRTVEIDLSPGLLGGAAVLGLVDLLIAYYLGGAMGGILGLGILGWFKIGRFKGLGMLVLAVGLAVGCSVTIAGAETRNPPALKSQGATAGDGFNLKAMRELHLAYIITGDDAVDRTSEAGLTGLGAQLINRTSVEPGDPMGIDLEKDEVLFFPLIYWPITDQQTPLSPEAVLKVNRYLATGGTILFDTRDQGTALPGAIGAKDTADRLRRVLVGIDIPPLSQPGPDHVLTKAFYLLHDFPGRWTGGQLWLQTAEDRVNDGVTTVILGAHDWASAWAIDGRGEPAFPCVPGGEAQREQAMRFGINLVMYTLTGNYKADQVHIPAILERLGQ